MRQSYVFGGDTGLSYDQIQRRRQMADAMASGIGAPRNVGEGLSAIGKALAARGLNRQADTADKANREEFDGNWAKIFGGSSAVGGYTPIAPKSENQSIADDAMVALGKRPDFGALEKQYGLPSGYLDRTYQIESGGNPNAQNPNSSAGGGFQFIDSTAKAYGLTDKTDLGASADAAARLAVDNKRQLQAVLGREPTSAELYLAHQQGGGGAAQLLSNPNARAVDIVGRDAVMLNGGDENMTAGEFSQKWLGKFGHDQRGAGRVAGGGQNLNLQALAEAAGSPYASPGQKAVAQAMLQQQMQAMDPAYQLGIEQQKLEIDQMRNPQGYTQRTGAELGLDGDMAGSLFNVGPDGKITQVGGGGTNISVNTASEVGTIPQGFELFTDPETGGRSMRPISGGPVAIEQEELADKAEQAKEIKGTAATIVTDEIARARELIEGQSATSPATGPIGGLIQSLPFAESTRAGALGERLATIKANIGFDKLQSMRDASPTGGALGQVSEFENRLLQAVFGSLVQSQSQEDILYNLNRIENIYNRVIHEGVSDDEARKLIDEIEMQGFREPESGQSLDWDSDAPPGSLGLSEDDADLWQYATPQERKSMFGSAQ
ncbi:hypothetical protein [uncultured Roseobacter sp.]|uniref:hypothetical protein n=1 Tax=uncultured Roseobacter sp. TaxID=114847 RepID=UPI00260D2165|nr:hypothetical protein [uncultured Roseobacter sp.]